MQYSPQELKARLLRALDEENNVVDEATVLEVISILETYPITREQLESTRIGRHINELRKKTSNDALAKRAKKLVRSWHRLINDTPEAVSSGSTTGVNGERVDTPPMLRQLHALQAQNKSGPSSPASAYSPVTSPKVARGNVPSSLIRKSSLSPAPLAGAAPSNSSPRLPPAGSLAGGCPPRKQVTTPAVPGKLASPAVPGKSASPAVPGKSASPAIPGKSASPALVRSSSPHASVVTPSRVSPGLPHALPSRVSSPCRLPAASGSKGVPTSRLVSPASSPRLAQPRTSSPAMAGGSAGVRPGVASPALGRPRTASPALPPGAKPAGVSRVHSPVPGKTLPQQVSSPAAVPSRAISPRVSQLSRSEAGGSSRQSPKLQAGSPHPSAPSSGAPSPRVSPPCPPDGNEDSNMSWSPCSVASEEGKVEADPRLRLTGGESTPMPNNKHIRKSNHSSDSILKSGGKSDVPVSNMSRTDVANRKRTRTESPISQSASKKLKRSETPNLAGDDIVNGGRKGHRSKNGEKAKWVSGFRDASSLEVERPGTPDSCASGSQKGGKKVLCRAASVCSDSSRLGRTPKVKTTAQLIADLQKKSASASVGNDIIEKLNTNQIVKEQDVQNSVLPPGVKPRSRRKKDESDSEHCSVPSSGISMSQTKSELVQKFLDSFETPSSRGQASAPDSPPMPSTSTAPPPAPKNSRGPPLSKSPGPAVEEQQQQHKIPTLEEITSQLSPLNRDSIDWGSLDYTVPSPSQPREVEDMNLLQSDPIPNVNGCYDSRGRWRDWTQTFTVSYPDNSRMHVLPYVVLD